MTAPLTSPPIQQRLQAVFAIPGDKDRRTGGFIYEARVLAELNALGCNAHHLQLPDSFPVPTKADMESTIALLQVVPASQPIILDGLVFGALDPDALALIKAPVIAMLHHPLGMETGIAPALSQHLLRNEAACLNHAAHVVVPSPHTALILTDEFGASPDKITIAPPGFDRPVGQHCPQTPPLIVSVGLLAQRKGHDILLQALSMITDLPWQTEIIGKRHVVETAEALLSLRDSLGLAARVKFTGELDDTELNNRLNAATVFALATRYEGYGMVLSEAMLYGLPVVSCATGAVPDTVGAAAILVPVDDPTAFANALRDLLTDDASRMALSEAALASAQGLPSWRDTAEIHYGVVDRLTRLAALRE